MLKRVFHAPKTSVNISVNFFTQNVYAEVYFWSTVNKTVNFFSRNVYAKVYGTFCYLKQGGITA